MVLGKEYVQFVKDTFELQGSDEAGDYLILGLLSEVGEVADVFKKALINKKPLNKKDLISELGDVAWYSTALALETRSPSQVAKVIDSTKTEPHDKRAMQEHMAKKDFLMIYEVLRDLEDNSSIMASPVKFRKRMEILSSFADTLNLELHKVLKANMDKLKKKGTKK